MENQHSGSCLCGAAKFTIEGVFERFYLCHCAHCRKDTGSANAANLFSSTATLVWHSGQDKVKAYTLPDTRHIRCFCSVCGSALPHAGHERLVVPAGCLDTRLTRAPDAHIFVASRAAWDSGLDALPEFSTFPS